MEPIKSNTPWWRTFLNSIYEHYLPEILRIFLQNIGITVPMAPAVQADQAVPREKNLYAGQGPVQRGKKVGTINAKVVFENASASAQHTLPSMPSNVGEYDNVFMQKGSTSIYENVDTINAETTFR